MFELKMVWHPDNYKQRYDY